MDVYIVCKLCALIEWCITVILCMWEVLHAVGVLYFVYLKTFRRAPSHVAWGGATWFDTAVSNSQLQHDEDDRISGSDKQNKPPAVFTHC